MAGEPFPKHLSGLDALRGMAAVAVVFCHVVFLGKFPASPFVKAVAAEFTLAVPMFFALSAFVLAHVYGGKLDTWPRVSDYALRRFFRIAPLFYFLTAAWLIWRQVNLGRIPSLDIILLNNAFLFPFSAAHYGSLVAAGWSIGIEMVFYVVLPLILLAVKNTRSAAALTIMAFLIGYAVDVFSTLGPTDSMRRMSIVANVANFGMGLTAFFIYRDLVGKDAVTRRLISILCLLAASAIWVTAFMTAGYFGSVAESYLWRYFVSSAFPFLILAVALWDWKFLVNKVTVWLGEVSYSVYLLHCLVITLANPYRRLLYAEFPGNWWLPLAISFAVILTVTLVLAWVTYTFIEVPGRRIATYRLRRKALVAVPAE